jgi:hypothetical protein
LLMSSKLNSVLVLVLVWEVMKKKSLFRRTLLGIWYLTVKVTPKLSSMLDTTHLDDKEARATFDSQLLFVI